MFHFHSLNKNWHSDNNYTNQWEHHLYQKPWSWSKTCWKQRNTNYLDLIMCYNNRRTVILKVLGSIIYIYLKIYFYWLSVYPSRHVISSIWCVKKYYPWLFIWVCNYWCINEGVKFFLRIEYVLGVIGYWYATSFLLGIPLQLGVGEVVFKGSFVTTGCCLFCLTIFVCGRSLLPWLMMMLCWKF